MSIEIDPDELDAVAARFGVGEMQVRRDHAISHILAALSDAHRDELIFFGGTALSRTYLIDQRLSEDIDLIATGDRMATVARATQTIEQALIRSHGRIQWRPSFSPNSDLDAAILLIQDGQTAIRIQLLSQQGYEPWPVEEQIIEQRYSDARPATLRTPTLPSFAAWKTAAWHDRSSPRDLYDLWAMSRIGALNEEAATLFARHGPINSPPRPWMFINPPTEDQWTTQLGEQTILTITAHDALTQVRSAWSAALNEDRDH